MREVGKLTLQIQPPTTTTPARVCIIAAGALPDDQGAIHLSAECLTLEEVERQINALQDELDALHTEARPVLSQQAGEEQDGAVPASVLVFSGGEAAKP